MTRIKLHHNGMTATMALADGNPGAIRVCAELLAKGAIIDPQAGLGGMANLLDLDTNQIYGSRIWMLYKDVCHENLRIMIGMLRAVQLGYLSPVKLNHAIDNYGDGVDVAGLMAKVEARLSDFQRAHE